MTHEVKVYREKRTSNMSPMSPYLMTVTVHSIKVLQYR